MGSLSVGVTHVPAFVELALSTTHSSTGAGAWADLDLSAEIPANAVSVLVDMQAAAGGGISGIRAKGSVLDRSMSLPANGNRTDTCLLNAGRVIQIWDGSGPTVFRAIGYWL